MSNQMSYSGMLGASSCCRRRSFHRRMHSSREAGSSPLARPYSSRSSLLMDYSQSRKSQKSKWFKDIGDTLDAHICASLESEVHTMLAAQDRRVHQHPARSQSETPHGQRSARTVHASDFLSHDAAVMLDVSRIQTRLGFRHRSVHLGRLAKRMKSTLLS